MKNTTNFMIFSGTFFICESINSIILSIGIIAFMGVLSSWATCDKNLDLTFCIRISLSLNLVMSLHIAIICFPPVTTLDFTWMNLRGAFDLNTVVFSSINARFLLMGRVLLIMWDHKFSFIRSLLYSPFISSSKSSSEFNWLQMKKFWYLFFWTRKVSFFV